ncbi:RNA polymerase I transcription factor TFIIS subunit RPA12 [Klebsormidium nitens]|uniref:DNA-directed RNA polymerase subunit n=1 Tax=Klebsormidium nitens TaxID=105231 RepID=A0A1Y1IFX1_KLENI|nr:RNA polymerase I transcription factor TFIIS subunit RPA12 [Klebsormidium nitens]|eukprot:GAQ87008.1 RNA polymerase I transcription factor TFIIS subunit RPA12 [Klebsormidium nitens]
MMALQRSGGPAHAPQEAYAVLFCPQCGSLLDLPESKSAASCPLCNFHRSVEDMESIEVVVRSTPEDFRRRYGIEPLVKATHGNLGSETPSKDGRDRQRATVDEDCPSCGHRELEYYTLQLRSADEGQTVFYECTKCHHKFAQNT